MNFQLALQDLHEQVEVLKPLFPERLKDLVALQSVIAALAGRDISGDVASKSPRTGSSGALEES